MKRFIMAVILLIIPIVPSLSTAGTDDSLKITFGRDEGRDAFERIIREQGSSIAALVERQLADSLSWITVISNSDGVRYQANHRKRNTLMTEERSVTGATLLDYYCADLTRINVVPLNHEADTGNADRYIIFIFSRSHPRTSPRAGLIALNGARLEPPRFDATCHPPAKPPMDLSDTCCQGTQLWLGIGASYTPHERLVPHAQVLWGTEAVRIIGEVGYSFYKNERVFADEELDVTYRYVFVGIAWRAIRYSQFDLLAAWQRSEVYSTHYGHYARKLEGPAVGIRLLLNEHLTLTGLWTPSEEQLRGRDQVKWDNNRFYVGLNFFTVIAGGK